MQNEEETLYATMRPARGGRSLVTLSTFEDRQEALRNTAIMEDEVNHRASRNFTPNGNHNATANRNEIVENGQTHHNIPPPPPQFANSPPKQIHPVTNNYKTLPTTTTASATTKASTSNTTLMQKPPSSPIPDYDNVDVRAHYNARPNYNCSSINITNNSRESFPAANASNRRTMRLDTVTIGEYEQQTRKEPCKFDFINTPKRHNVNGNNSGGNSNSHNNANGRESLHSELQNTLTRSNLKKSNNNYNNNNNNNDAMLEHQSDCPLRHSYENNYENVTRKLQTISLNGKGKVSANGGTMANAATTITTQRNGTNTNGILKNGNRNSGANFSKNTDKTITFGN